MIKSDLVRRVAGKNPHLHAKDAERIVNAVLDVIGAALARRDRVETRGFGVFTVRLQSARPGRNRRTARPSVFRRNSILTFGHQSHAQSAQSRDGIMKAVNREAEIASLLISGFGVAFFGWALVHLASSPSYPNKDDRRATESRFRRWLDATRHPLLKAENDLPVAAGALRR